MFSYDSFSIELSLHSADNSIEPFDLHTTEGNARKKERWPGIIELGRLIKSYRPKGAHCERTDQDNEQFFLQRKNSGEKTLLSD